MAQLTIAELRKRNNFKKLLSKIRLGEPLLLTRRKQEELHRETVVVTPEPYLLSGLSLLAEDPSLFPTTILPELTTGNILLLPIGEDLLLPSGALQKTWEFGSKTCEMIYEKEGRECRRLKETIRRLTMFGTKPIRLIVNSQTGQQFTYGDILGIRAVRKIDGKSPKADFEFVNFRKQVILSISHKYGYKARDFRQWSGVFEFRQHPEVIQFGEDLHEHLKRNHPTAITFPPRLSLAREIVDDNLKRKAVYGQGEGSVDFLVQGECGFVPTGNKFEHFLTANLILHREDPMNILPTSHQPVILVRRGDIKRGSFGIKGCRGVIYPAEGRKINTWFEPKPSG